jgi:hypothetical protein
LSHSFGGWFGWWVLLTWFFSVVRVLRDFLVLGYKHQVVYEHLSVRKREEAHAPHDSSCHQPLLQLQRPSKRISFLQFNHHPQNRILATMPRETEDDASRQRNVLRRLCVATCICTCFLIVEMIGGWLAGSLAIVSDAAHLFADLASFAVASKLLTASAVSHWTS